MSLAPDRTADGTIGLGRLFTSAGVDPYDEVVWERRDARITNWLDGSVVFEQLDVEFPITWSINATNIVTQKYFRGTLGSPERESSLKQVVDRIVGTITEWGIADGYFDGDEADAFCAELKYILVTQRAAFNSPVWFNIGVRDVPQQASACFILAVDDEMPSILNWYREEGLIFKGGSGAGVNLSRIRSSFEPLEGGGTASGPVSFMRGADASAGTIKSGGKTRRAAKMVILDADHPDIGQFVWTKAIEERKARVLADAGFDMGLDGVDSFSVQYQNANNSVRVTDEFMQAVVDDADWNLTAVTTGEVLRTVKARQLWREIAEAAWECADPGLQFDTTINRWHTAPNHGRITASNPCSEYFHVENSACNLASINLLKYLQDDGGFDVGAFTHTVDTVFTAQEILVGRADYPTEKIGDTTRALRQLGLGYANLGALLMALGLPYDSDDGRAWAAAITSLMTGSAYAASARTAARVGPFDGFASDSDAMLRVLEMHQEANDRLAENDALPDDLVDAAADAWERAISDANRHGVRNSQSTVLAPTGTIGLAMDCDTTGIEPDLALVKTKKLVGGGTMSIVNQTIPRALRRLGYTPEQVDDIVAYIDDNMSVLGAPHLAAEHLPVFACSMGDNTIHYEGHIRMMGAVQPFLSGGISKTANMPEDVTVEDVEGLHMLAWELGLKSVAIYRDNCKLGQPLSSSKGRSSDAVDRTRSARCGRGRRAAGDRAHRAPSGAPEDAADASRAHVRVPGGRLQGLRHDRRVRQRPAGRDLPHRVEAGLHHGRRDGRVRQVRLVRPAVRRAAAGVRRGVHQHALRAGRHDRRPRHPLRLVDHGLPVPAVGHRVHDLRRTCRTRHLLRRRTFAADLARRRGAGDAHEPGFRSRARPEVGRHRPAVVPDGSRRHSGTGHGQAERCADVHAVRRHDDALGKLLRLHVVRQHQRLQLRSATSRPLPSAHERCRT